MSGGDEEERDAVLRELEALAASEITDVLTWDSEGNVEFLGSDALSHRARKGIKKVKVTPTRNGNSIEIEMHDKMSALRLLAKHVGLLETNADINRPTLIGINVTGADVEYTSLDGPIDPRVASREGDDDL